MGIRIDPGAMWRGWGCGWLKRGDISAKMNGRTVHCPLTA